MKIAFYTLYSPIFRSMHNTKIITQLQYNEIFECLNLYDTMDPAKRTASMRRYYRKYKLFANVHSTCLIRANSQGNWVRVATFENMFDIINTIHVNVLGHQRDKDKNRQIIEKHYYGIPISAIETYISICEECLGSKKKVTKKIKIP